MPDLTATRPVSGESVATLWGQQVHDAIEGLQAGSVTVNVSASAFGEATVTFPRAYASAPALICSVGNSQSAFYAQSPSQSATTAILRAVHRDGTSTTTSGIVVHWIAIGTPA